MKQYGFFILLFCWKIFMYKFNFLFFVFFWCWGSISGPHMVGKWPTTEIQPHSMLLSRYIFHLSVTAYIFSDLLGFLALIVMLYSQLWFIFNWQEKKTQGKASRPSLPKFSPRVIDIKNVFLLPGKNWSNTNAEFLHREAWLRLWGPEEFCFFFFKYLHD